MTHAMRLLCVLLALGVAVGDPETVHRRFRRSVQVAVVESLGESLTGASSDTPRGLSHESYTAGRRIRRQSTDGLDWNMIVDGLLVQARANVMEEGKDEVPIPDIEENFDKKVGFIKLNGNFVARQGRVNSVASIQRTGDVSFGGDPGQTVTLTAHLGFGTLHVKYHEYRINLLGATTSGDISASVASNSVRLKARLAVTETTCSLALEEVTVVDLSGFDVRISGLGALDWLTSKIATWVANKRRGDIIQNLERALKKNLERALEKFNCDEHFDKIRDFQGLVG